jgi:signal transduction histidine kinase/ActR/RegA family two-component response regulator
MSREVHETGRERSKTDQSENHNRPSADKRPERVLLLEDSRDDALLLRIAITREWPSCEIVLAQDRASFERALGLCNTAPVNTNSSAPGARYDVILSDYCFPTYSGKEALTLAKECAPQTPFIFISGMMGDEVAVECLKAGATDYVLKDRLSRLVPVIKRALKEADERARRERAEVARHNSESKLEQSNRELRKKNEEIQNFYHTLSHELKTPLTSANEFISIVLDGLAGPVTATQTEYLGIARDSCRQLRMCIDDLLDTTRLDTGKMVLDFKPASLAELVQRVTAAMKPKAAEKNIHLHDEVMPDAPMITMDEHRITQVISNLLTNAIKYTPAGGSIHVKLQPAPEHVDLVQVSVSDTGCGIPRAERDRIFDRLYQVRAGDAATEKGIGLGLFLCRELVELHGGRIWVESHVGGGSTFAFVLPKNQQALRSNVLVIDDDLELLEVLRLTLSSEGYNVRTAPGGWAGLAEMRRQRPDIVMLDLAMPEINGAATLKEIRKDWGAVPVIVHTGFADGDLMQQAIESSPFTLLAKPARPQQILETIRKVERADDTAIWKRNHFGFTRPRNANHNNLAADNSEQTNMTQ